MRYSFYANATVRKNGGTITIGQMPRGGATIEDLNLMAGMLEKMADEYRKKSNRQEQKERPALEKKINSYLEKPGSFYRLAKYGKISRQTLVNFKEGKRLKFGTLQKIETQICVYGAE